MAIKNQVQLITYPDSLGANLMELHYVLRKYLIDAIGGVHILPFYPSSSDRGFAPLTYEEVCLPSTPICRKIRVLMLCLPLIPVSGPGTTWTKSDKTLI